MQEIETTPTIEDSIERGFPSGGFPHEEYAEWLDAHQQPITPAEEDAMYADWLRKTRQLAGGSFTFEMKVRGRASVVSIRVLRDITPEDYGTWNRRDLFEIESVMQSDRRGEFDAFDLLNSSEVLELQSAAFAEATEVSNGGEAVAL